MPLKALRLLLALAGLTIPAVVSAQTGSIVGRVTEPVTGRAVANARLEATHTTTAAAAPVVRSDENGEYRIINLQPGTYSVLATAIGYQSKRVATVVVSPGLATRADVTLSEGAMQLGEVITTASRREEKVLDAPVSVSVVTEQQVQERPSLTVADHVRNQPGVDVSQGGLVQSNIVSRGFNNAFSGAMLILQDNRFSAVPSLRVNVPLLFPSVNEDIERIELLLGPAAALYGPNSASGVMHIITKSPFTSQGATLTFDGGERGVIRGAGRFAGILGETFGYKLSGEILRGRDWVYHDPAEPATVERPTGEIQNGMAVRQTVTNARDFDIRKAAGEARVDLRLRPGMEWINTFGMTHVGNFIEITGANGAAQARNWQYRTYQSRLTWNGTFAQIFLNTSDAGNRDSLDTRGTYLLRTGTPIVDQSRVLSAQLQQAIDVGMRQSFVIGADYIHTDPRTGGTINGRNEDIDKVTEVGGYLHSITRISPLFEFVGAIRFDGHSEMDENFFSPRAALVFKPSETQNVRLTYNRAFSTPANFSFFLDLPAGTLRPTVPYDVRALGVPSSGFAYARNSGAASGLFMRSPFPVLDANPAGPPLFGPNTRIDANAALMYRTIVAGSQQAFVNALLAAGVQPADVGTVFGALLGGAPPAGVQTMLRLFNPSGVGTPEGPFATIVDPSSLEDVEPLKATFNNVLELGYKAIVSNRLRVAVDVWTQKRENFITPAVNVAPNAFMDPATLAAHIAGVLTAQAQAGRVPAAAIPALTQGFTTTLASVPVGTVAPDQVGVDPDAGLTNRPDIVFTYRNIEQAINLWGSDLAIDLFLTETFSLLGTYSYVNKTSFPDVQSGTDVLRLNAPGHKSSLAARYRDDARGWAGELRGRYMNAFPVNSGVYVGDVPVNAFLDASISWRPPMLGRSALISLSALNVLDNRRNSFIGVPEIGRLVMTRLQYNW
jgi:outer membrane receptor for ferrienterochelin and colicins